MPLTRSLPASRPILQVGGDEPWLPRQSTRRFVKSGRSALPKALGWVAVVVMGFGGLTACAPNPADADSATHCSDATERWALVQSAKGATIATTEQLAEAPSWLPTAPACATVSAVNTLWIFPNATRGDFDAVLDALRDQGKEVPDATGGPDRLEVLGYDFVVTLTSKGVDATAIQTMLVIAP